MTAPGRRQHRRSALDLLRGLAALLLLAALTAGIPAGLLTVGGNPLPGRWPGLTAITGALTRPDDGTLFLTVLALLGWLAWAAFTTTLTVEVAARLRGLPTPRLPALAVPQRLTAGLVTAVALLLAVQPGLPALATPTGGGLPAPAAVTAGFLTGHPPPALRPAARTARQQPGPAARPPGGPAAAGHLVAPGESLWGIAAAHLGDGSRWRELAELNYGRPQPGGATLSRDHWLQPGWTLLLPGTATTATGAARDRDYPVRAGDTLWDIARHELGDGTAWPRIAAASTGEQPDGEHLGDPDRILPGWHLTVPAPSPLSPPQPGHPPATAAHDVAPGSAAAGLTPRQHLAGSAAGTAATTPPAPPPAASTAHPERQESSPRGAPTAGPSVPPGQPASPPAAAAPPPEPAVAAQRPTPPGAAPTPAPSGEPGGEGGEPPVAARTAAGLGALLAAALLTLIGLSRGRQRRRRRPGERLPAPPTAAVRAEAELRRVAAPEDLDILDRGLRTLAAGMTARGAPLPGLRLIRSTGQGLELTLATPAQLPAPFTATPDPARWVLPPGSALLDPEAAAQVPAPYPQLVTVGQDLTGAHALLDLEETAVLTVRGDPQAGRDVLAALALELATHRAADGLLVTLLGACPGLPGALGDGRARHVGEPAVLLAELTVRDEEIRSALQYVGADSVRAARSTDRSQGHWPSEVIFLGPHVDPQVRADLVRAVLYSPDTGLAVVVAEPDAEPGSTAPDLELTNGGEVLWVPAAGPARLLTLQLDLHAQRLPPADYQDVLDLLTTARTPAAWPPAVTTDPDPAAPSPALGTEPYDPAEDGAVPGADGPWDAGGPLGPAHAEHVRNPFAQHDAGIGHFGDIAVSVADSPLEEPAEDRVIDLTASNAAPLPGLGLAPAGAGPLVWVLGPVEVHGAAGELEPTKRGQLTEILCWLALHPGQDHHAFDEAIYPRAGAVMNTRNTALSKLRRWLGSSPDGHAYVPLVRDGGYRLHPGVRTDWQHWLACVGTDPKSARTEDLRCGLELVRGQPFAGTPPHRYAWAEPARQEMIAALGDAAHELAVRALRAGDPPTARFAATAGLAADPGSELLWRDAFRAERLAGDRAALDHLIGRLTAIAADLGEDLEPDTVALLEELQRRNVTTAAS